MRWYAARRAEGTNLLVCQLVEPKFDVAAIITEVGPGRGVTHDSGWFVRDEIQCFHHAPSFLGAAGRCLGVARELRFVGAAAAHVELDLRGGGCSGRARDAKNGLDLCVCEKGRRGVNDY